MAFSAGDIAVFALAFKEIGNVVVADRPAFKVRFQIPFGDVGTQRIAIDQNMIPRAILWRFAGGDLVVPVFGTVEVRINIDDHATIFKQPVVDQLPGGAFCVCSAHVWGTFHCTAHDRRIDQGGQPVGASLSA